MYEPDSAVRGVQMLSGILNPVFSNDLEMFNRELLDWEHRVQQYEGAHKALATEVKVAIILGHAPDVVKRFLTVTSDRFGDYNQLRTTIQKYTMRSTVYDNHGNVGNSKDSQGPVPMDIGNIGLQGKGFNGKGGTKGDHFKGKSKGDQKGKGKGKGKAKGKSYQQWRPPGWQNFPNNGKGYNQSFGGKGYNQNYQNQNFGGKGYNQNFQNQWNKGKGKGKGHYKGKNYVNEIHPGNQWTDEQWTAQNQEQWNAQSSYQEYWNGYDPYPTDDNWNQSQTNPQINQGNRDAQQNINGASGNANDQLIGAIERARQPFLVGMIRESSSSNQPIVIIHQRKVLETRNPECTIF